jgi:hypothetical protein
VSIPWFPAGSIFHARKSEQVVGQESPSTVSVIFGVSVILSLRFILVTAIRRLGRLY